WGCEWQCESPAEDLWLVRADWNIMGTLSSRDHLSDRKRGGIRQFNGKKSRVGDAKDDEADDGIRPTRLHLPHLSRPPLSQFGSRALFSIFHHLSPTTNVGPIISFLLHSDSI